MSNLNFTIQLKMKGQNEVEQLFTEIGKKHNVDVNLDTSKIQAGISSIQNPIKEIGTNIMHSFAQFGFAIGGIKSTIALIKGAISPLVTASNVQEDAVTSLEAALRNTGLEVEEVSGKLQSYASSIQDVTRYGDEAILAGTALAQNIGRFGADILPSVQKAAVGLSATYKMDLKTAFELIGRASKGQTSTLTRYGIILDTTKSKSEQFDQILRMGADGFSIAKDEAENGSGALEQYQNIVGDLQEGLGSLIKTALVPLAKWLSGGVQKFTKFIQSITNLAQGYGLVRSASEEMRGEMAKSIVEYNSLAYEIDNLAGKTNKTADDKEKLKGLIGTLNTEYKDYLPNLVSEKDNYNDIATAIKTAKDNLLDFVNLKVIDAMLKDLTSEMEDMTKVIREVEVNLEAWKLEKLQKIAIKFDIDTSDTLSSAFNKMEAAINDPKINELSGLFGLMEQSAFGVKDAISQIPKQYRLTRDETDAIAKSGIITSQYANKLYGNLTLQQKAESNINKLLERKNILIDKFGDKLNLLNNDGGNGNNGQTNILPKQEDIDKAKSALDAFFLSLETKQEQLKADFRSKSSLIYTAYAGNPEELHGKISELNKWFKSESDKLQNEEIAAKEKATEEEIKLEQKKYQIAIKLLQAKKQLGLDVTGELKNAQDEYTAWLKETYGADTEAYLNALKDKKEATEKLWQANNRLVASGIDAMVAGFRSGWSTILDTEMTGKQRREAIWEDMKQSFMNTVGDMAKEWIKKQLLQIVMSKTAGKIERSEAIKTAATEKISILSTITLKVQSALASIGGAIAGGFRWLVSTLGPVGLGLGVALGAGIIAAFNGIRKKLGFASGGYTGDGDKLEEAGVVHKGEAVFEQEVTKPNLPELLGLRKLLQKGYKLKDLLMPTIHFPQVSFPEPQLAGSGYAGGGYVAGSSNNNFNNEIHEEIKGLRGDLKSMNLKVELIDKRTAIMRHKERIDDGKKYDRQYR